MVAATLCYRGNSKGAINMWAGSLKPDQDLYLEPELFDTLKGQYIGLIHSWINKACHKFEFERKGVSRADLLQMCYVLLVLAYKNHEPDRGASKLSTVLVSYMKNAFLAVARSRHVDRIVNFTDFDGSVSDDSFRNKGPFSSTIVEEQLPLRGNLHVYDSLKERVEHAIESLYKDGFLSVDDIQIYRMTAGGMKQTEICGIFGVTNERIRQKLNRTIEKIQRRVRLLENQ